MRKVAKEYDRDNKRKYSEVGSIIIDMLEKKKITQAELARRCGYRAMSNLHDRLLMDMSYTTLKRICEGLGVELCIIDGWQKYTLAGKTNADIDRFLQAMRYKEPNTQKSDRYEEDRSEALAKKREKSKEFREKDREAYNAYHREYNRRRKEALMQEKVKQEGVLCTKCANCEPKLRKNGNTYCKFFDRYTVKSACSAFTDKTE